MNGPPQMNCTCIGLGLTLPYSDKLLLLLLLFYFTGNRVNESNGSTVVKPLLKGDDVKELEEQQGTTSV